LRGRRRCGTFLGVKSLLARGGDQAIVHPLPAGKLACPPYRVALFPVRLFRRLLIKPTSLHFPEDAFALHFLLQDSKSLVDVVVSDEDPAIASLLAAQKWLGSRSESRVATAPGIGLNEARLSYFEFAFLRHAFMLLASAFDAVPILALIIWKLPNDFVRTVGCIAI